MNGVRRASCQRCQRPLGHCLCALIPQLPSRSRVLVLQHPDEARHALNTARLAVLGLGNAQLEVGERFDALDDWLLPGHRHCLLFPGEQAQCLPLLPRSGLPVQLVVPDGSWRKARKLLHLNPRLHSLPRVTLAAGAPSRYRLRKAPAAAALSTIEAIARALEAEEGRSFEALLAPFDALIDGQIAAMGEATFRRNHG